LIRDILVFFAVSLACVAQYVPTNDGSRLFFTSSDRLVGTNQSLRSKLFSWDAEHGVQLVYESPTEYICCISITGDGSLAAFSLVTADDAPRTKGGLLNLGTEQVEIVGSRAIISRNGHYLFTGDALVDRIAGTSRPVSVGAAFVGSDGSILYRDLNSLHRIDPDGTDRTVMSGFRFGTLIDADENTTTAIVIPATTSTVVLDTITGRQVDLSAAGGSTMPAFLSRDGQWVTFGVQLPPDYHAHVILCRSDASDCKILTNPPILASAIGISGDASTVYASFQNRIWRIDTSTGRTERAFGFASFSPLAEAPIVPGSLVRFYALNAGDHIAVNGVEAPVLSSPGGAPVIQVPWDLPDQWVKFTMSGGDSPFETFTRTYPISDFFPQGFAPGSPGLNEGQPAYRQDWSATTYESPATAGEIVHIYAVGLGAVDCPVENGKPAPLDRLCRSTRMVDWQWTTAPGTTLPAEVQFAGLAPGMVGLYQIDVRVPPYNGYEFIELSDGVRNLRVAFVRVRQ
jgi:uncharacterized protein (TIGR03437 family)